MTHDHSSFLGMIHDPFTCKSSRSMVTRLEWQQTGGQTNGGDFITSWLITVVAGDILSQLYMSHIRILCALVIHVGYFNNLRNDVM